MMDIVNFDFEQTIKDYDYTKRAVYNLNDVLDSNQFKEKDAETIFQYLSEKMQMISFGDYMKRYIYELAGMDEPFSSIPEEEYIEIIKEAFEENRAPQSFQATTRRWSVTLKSFVRSNSVSRDQVFLIGFGLAMPDDEVSMFLTKVLKEQDFNFFDPREIIFWHCYHNGHTYLKAKQLMEYYENSQGAVMEAEQRKSIEMNPKVYLSNEKILLSYLDCLACKEQQTDLYDKQYQVYLDLYRRTIDMINDIYEKDPDKIYKEDRKIGSADIEKLLYAGVPVNEKGNLLKLSSSVLAAQFEKKRLTRQRLDQILNRKINVDRFDIITLLFYIYAETVEPDWPTERYMQYIDEVNEKLEACEFMGIYPVNPYESFVLMCLLSESPMLVFDDIWALSYGEEI